MFENYIVVYKSLGDLMFYVTGSQDENELILYSVLQAFFESISILLRYAALTAKRTLRTGEKGLSASCSVTAHAHTLSHCTCQICHAGSRWRRRLCWRTSISSC